MPLPPAWFPLRYHELQQRLWTTKHRFVAVAAGRGSGKTELARRRVVRFLPVRKPWHDPIYFYALPTIAQAKRVAWKPIVNLIPPEWIRKINQSELSIETVYGSTLYVVGMDKPQRIEGVQWDGGVIDESSDQKPGSFDLSVLPALSHKNGWCWRIGVPKRHGIGAREFKTFFDNKGEVDSYTWPSSSVLTPEQLAWAERNLDPRDFNEQYNATWESASGAIFYAYDDTLNVSEVAQYNPKLPIVVGSDFNVDPMCWVIGHIINIDEQTKHVHIFDELFIRNTNTPSTLDELFRRYGNHQAGFYFFGDASGRARKTSANFSDYVLIKQDARFKGSRIFYPQANPRLQDRFAACNAMFCNAANGRRSFINPKCKHLRADLLERAYEEGTSEPNDEGDVGHISDAFGYIIHRMFPVRAILTDKNPSVFAGRIEAAQRKVQALKLGFQM